MDTHLIPYEPYHPHLGYTLLVTCVAWLLVHNYCEAWLQRRPNERLMLVALVIGLPLYAEVVSYLIYLMRPAADTHLGRILTRLHAYVINQFPIDTILSLNAWIALALSISAIVGWSLFRLVISSRALARLVWGAPALHTTEYASILDRFTALIQWRGSTLPIFLMRSSSPVAFVTGVLRPRIYISSAIFELLNEDEALAVLCHEWAHIARRDTVLNVVSLLCRNLFYFMPFRTFAWRSLLADQEKACDELASRLTNEPLTLARALLKVSAALQPEDVPGSLRVAMRPFAMGTSGAEERIASLINLSDAQIRARGAVVGAYALAAAILVMGVLPALLGS